MNRVHVRVYHRVDMHVSRTACLSLWGHCLSSWDIDKLQTWHVRINISSSSRCQFLDVQVTVVTRRRNTFCVVFHLCITVHFDAFSSQLNTTIIFAVCTRSRREARAPRCDCFPDGRTRCAVSCTDSDRGKLNLIAGLLSIKHHYCSLDLFNADEVDAAIEFLCTM